MASLAERLRAGERGLSVLFLGGTDLTLVEMAGAAGFDVVVLDAEHGMAWTALPALLVACRAAGVPGIVRVLPKRPDMIHLALDWGADGVLVPGIESVEEAKRAVEAGRYAPQGRRGVAFSTRGAWYGKRSGPEFLAEANRTLAILLQVETRGALDQLDALLALEGYDGIFVGPTDLSVALGEQSRLTPRVEAVIEDVVRRAEAVHKPWGLFVGTAARYKFWRERGAYYCATGITSLVYGAAEAWLKEGRGA